MPMLLEHSARFDRGLVAARAWSIRDRLWAVRDQQPFAGGDQTYLRDVQYVDGTNLNARVALHVRFSTAAVPLPDFEAGLIDWQPGYAVLECGSGTGQFWTNRFTPRSVAATLTDLSPGMVANAVASATANGFENVTGRECDVQDLPFNDDSFDVVVANHMLYHVPDPDRAVAELARVVRPEGVVLAATNGRGHMQEMNDVIGEVFESAISDGLYDVFGLDTGEARLRRQFAQIVWHAFDNDLVVDDPVAAIAYGLSFPPGDAATDEEATAFAVAMTDRFVDGPLRIRTRAGVFVAKVPRSG